MIRHLPIKLLMHMGLSNFIRPKTNGWGRARAAIEEYVEEREAEHRKALKLTEPAE
jgi:hypothetical protein